MIKKKIYIFVLLSAFVVALSAFQTSLTFPLKSETDSLHFMVPQHFPRPVYTFKNNKLTENGFKLGKALFYDPLLSADRSVSCGSCHQASAAFANLGSALSTGVKNCKGTRNAPPLFNLAWQKEFMWDGRISSMDQVPVNALTNPCEMANTMDSVVIRLRADPLYPALFKQAFGGTVITSDQVLKAIAQFTVMLISADSKYDRHVNHRADGDFTADEEAGYLLFREKCSSCHTEPLFSDGSYRNNGLEKVSVDIGRDSLTKNRADRGKFRVPSLRNIEITKPYMHDGRFSSLKQVLQHYNSGIQQHASLDPVLKQGIPLSIVQQTQLIAFLKTLTDLSFINDRRFNNH